MKHRPHAHAHAHAQRLCAWGRAAPWLTLTVLAAASASALAQQAAPAPAAAASAPQAQAEDANTAQTITVSATRRREAIRDVPISLTKISADAQLELGAKDLTDVLATVPGVSYNLQGKAGQGEIVIRGVATGSTANPAVAVYVDDVPVGASTNRNLGSNAFDQRLLDLSNIEVLKGPQGTLYGASAMGGLLKYNTRVPDTTLFSGQLGAEASRTSQGGNNYTAFGNVNVPLSEGTAALRAAVFHAKDGGYIDATGPAGGTDTNRGTTTGGRVAFGLRPFKGFDVRLSAQTQETKYDGDSYASYGNDSRPTAGDLVRSNLVRAEPNKLTNDLVTLNLEYELGWARLYSITGVQRMRQSGELDLNAFLAVLPPFFTQLQNSSTAKLDKTTQEFRVVSASGGAIEWLGGVFYAHEKSDGTSLLTASTAPGAPLPSGVRLFDNAGILNTWKETAVYGTVVWNVSSDLALTAGARAARNSLDLVQRDFGLQTQNKITESSSKESPNTYLLAARYKLSPSASVYARAASGYRAGGPNTPVINATTGVATTADPYKSDSLWSYEVGYKADLPDKLGSFDVALFQTDWTDLQTFVDFQGTRFLGNAGKARIRGLEFGSVLRPTSSLTLRAAASLMDPKLLEDSPGLGGKAGDRLPISAKVAASFNARYDFEVAATPSFVALNLSHTGTRYASFDGNLGLPNYKLPAYTTLDLNAGASVAGFDLGLYVRNLTDERGQLSVSTTYAAFGQPNLVSLIRPRTVGVTVSRQF
jgi:iron complex outermembrane recepter protein